MQTPSDPPPLLLSLTYITPTLSFQELLVLVWVLCGDLDGAALRFLLLMADLIDVMTWSSPDDFNVWSAIIYPTLQVQGDEGGGALLFLLAIIFLCSLFLFLTKVLKKKNRFQLISSFFFYFLPPPIFEIFLSFSVLYVWKRRMKPIASG